MHGGNEARGETIYEDDSSRGRVRGREDLFTRLAQLLNFVEVISNYPYPVDGEEGEKVFVDAAENL